MLTSIFRMAVTAWHHRGNLLRRYAVEGESMLPAYQPGERLIAEAFTYVLRQPRLGEVVIVEQPEAQGRRDLKRIAAGPGMMVTVRGESVTLAKDEWFVLGDNFEGSTDSRSLGPLRRADIKGRVWFRY